MDTNLVILYINEHPNIGDQQQDQQVTVSIIYTSKVTIDTDVQMLYEVKDVATIEKQSGSSHEEKYQEEQKKDQVEKSTTGSKRPNISRPLNDGEEETVQPSSTSKITMIEIHNQIYKGT